MPTYMITDNQTGTQFKVTGDSPPTDAEMIQIFKDVGGNRGAKGYEPTTRPDRANDTAADFIRNEGTTTTKIKEGAKRIGRAAMPYVRPLLEGGGAVGGAIVGGTADIPTGVLPGAVIGAGLGYGAGAKTADILDTLVDQPTRVQPSSITGQLAQSAGDVATGATMEMGGQLVGKGAGWAWDKGKQLASGLRRSTPALTEQAVAQKAGQRLQENMGTDPQYAANAAEAAALEAEIPGYKMSLAERRNDPALIKLQRGLERASSSETPAANLMAEQKASNVDALKMHLADTFPGEADIAEVATKVGATKAEQEAATAAANEAATASRSALPAKAPQQLGQDILTEIETQAEPVKATMQKMGDQIPNYPISIPNLANEAEGFAKSRLVTIQERRALKPILDDIAARLDGTDGRIGLKELQTVQRNINDVISKELDGKASTDLMALKKAIQDDLDQFSGQVGSGQLAMHEGKLTDLDKIAAQFEKNAAELHKLRTPAEPDLKAQNKHLFEYLAGKKEVVMQNLGVTDAQYNKSLMDRLKVLQNKGMADDFAPAVGKLDEIRIKDLEASQQNLRRIMAEADPAVDAAAQYRAYNRFANEEYFNRFDRGALSRVTRRGNEASGTQTQLANIPAAFTRPDGADDLIKAIGKGRAADLMDQHFAHDLLQKANPATGELQASVAQNWLQKNAEVLEKYGLTTKYASVADAQAAVEAAKQTEKQFAKSATAKILNSDPEKAIEVAFQTYPKNTGRAAAELRDAMGGDPQALMGLQTAFKDFIIKKANATIDTIAGDKIIGAASLQKEMAKYEPAMKVLFAKEPEKLSALQNVQKAVEISARSNRSPLGGGSDTAENLNAAKSLLPKIMNALGGAVAGGGVGFATGGPIGALAGGAVGTGAKVIYETMSKHSAQEVEKLIVRAMYDADLAQTLIGAAKGTIKPEVVKTQINSHLITMGLIGSGANQMLPGQKQYTPEEIRAELKRRGY